MSGFVEAAVQNIAGLSCQGTGFRLAHCHFALIIATTTAAASTDL